MTEPDATCPSPATVGPQDAVRVGLCTAPGRAWLRPLARAEASAQARSCSACSGRHAARDTRRSTHRSRRQAAIRYVIATLIRCSAGRCSKLDGLTCFLAPLLPAPYSGPNGAWFPVRSSDSDSRQLGGQPGRDSACTDRLEVDAGQPGQQARKPRSCKSRDRKRIRDLTGLDEPGNLTRWVDPDAGDTFRRLQLT